MKILLVNKFHYLKGGSETYYFGLGELLKKQGHEVIYFSMKDERNVPCEQEKYFVENIDYNGKMSPFQMIKTGLKTLYSFEAKRKMEQLIRDEKPDIAHLNIFQSQLTGSIVDVLYKHGVPIVYTMHDLKAVCPTYLMMCHGEICKECIHGNFMPCIKKHCMKDSLAKSVIAAIEAKVYRWKKIYDKIDLIIAPSDHHRLRLEESEITNTRIITMRNFIPENIKFVRDIEAGTYFLYFGRLSVEKGILTLIKAFAKSNTKSQLYLVGSGPQEDKIKSMIKELGIEERVRLLGYKSGNELQQIVRGAKCVILPSECCENSPLAMIEAMAAGRPVLVSRNGGLPEIVVEGENGFVFNPKNIDELKDKINNIDIYADDKLLAMGINAQKYVAKTFDSEEYLDKILLEYHHLLNRKQ